MGALSFCFSSSKESDTIDDDMDFGFSAEKENGTTHIDTFYGTLYKVDESEYSLSSGGNSKNRKSIYIRKKEGFEQVFSSLSDYVGKEVKAEGIEISRKSPWNITIELVSVASAD